MPPITARLVRMEYSLRNPRDPYSYIYVDLIFRDGNGDEYRYHIPNRPETLGRRLREFWGAYGLKYDPRYGGMRDAADCAARAGELHIADTPVLIGVSNSRWYHRITSLRPVKEEA